MARRVNYYLIFRRVHLFAAFTTVGFLLLYFMTGFFMVWENLYDKDLPDPVLETSEIKIPNHNDAESLAHHIQETFDIPGQIRQTRRGADSIYHISFNHPKMTSQVTFDPKKGTVRVEKQIQNVHHAVNAFHRIHGYSGGFAYDLFAFMMDLASTALVLFSITGFILWLKVLKNKIWGLVFLFIGFSYTLWIVLTFLYR